jgi:hypothetical protein
LPPRDRETIDVAESCGFLAGVISGAADRTGMIVINEPIAFVHLTAKGSYLTIKFSRESLFPLPVLRGRVRVGVWENGE